MKKKLSIISALALVGVIGTGFATWVFAQEATGSDTVSVGIAGVETDASLGDYAFVGLADSYQLDKELGTLAIAIQFTPNASAEVPSDKNVQHTVTITAADGLEAYLDFGDYATGKVITFTSGAYTDALAVAWKSGKNPSNVTEYNTLKAIIDATTLITVSVSGVLV